MSEFLDKLQLIILVTITAFNSQNVYGDDAPPAPAAGGDAAAAPAGNGTGGAVNPLILKGWDNPRTKGNNTDLLSFDESVTEDPKINEEILKLEKSQCDHIYVYCMEHLQNAHRNVKPEKLGEKCFKPMKGFAMCGDYTKEDAAKAKENVEQGGGGGSGTEAPPVPEPPPAP